MSQKIYTKHFGEIEVERSWARDGVHVARLTNGRYAHISGLPVQSMEELEAALPSSELERARKWFEHRHDEPEVQPKRLLIDSDWNMVFDDGSPVESPDELRLHMRPGPMLDAALVVFAAKARGSRHKKGGESAPRDVDHPEPMQITA